MYYKQILISSGEVPEKEGYYTIESLDGKTVERVYFNGRGLNSYTKFPIQNYYWLKPIEGSPIDFARWTMDLIMTKGWTYDAVGIWVDWTEKTGKEYTYEELYDKYEEEHGK